MTSDEKVAAAFKNARDAVFGSVFDALRPGGHVVEARHQRRQRGLARARRAHERDHLARPHRDVEAVERVQADGSGTAYINAAIKDVYVTLSETLLIVCLVIFMFLGSWRSTIIPIIAILVALLLRGLGGAKASALRVV